MPCDVLEDFACGLLLELDATLVSNTSGREAFVVVCVFFEVIDAVLE